MALSILDDMEKMGKIDSNNMLTFCVDVAVHYRKATKTTEKISLHYANPENIIVGGMGGSAIGGELLKDWVRNKAHLPLEVCRAYDLPAYANEKSLVLIVSYSGETEEILNVFLDAVKRNCMIFCVSSGGSLLEFAEKLDVPFLCVPSGFPPRAALPYLFVPLLSVLEKTRVVESVSKELSESIRLLARIGRENGPDKPVNCNFAKTLAMGINSTIPVVYGFGFYRSVAQRFKQQFNENSKMPSKWEFFSELNHNEIMGWEQTGNLAECFSTIFIRDKNEPDAIHRRIEATKTFLPSYSKMFELWAQGESALARMLSTVCIGDFTSVYLAVLRGVDPTPVETIDLLKQKVKQGEMKEKIIRELEVLAASR